VRRVGLLLLVTVAFALELEQLGAGRSHSRTPSPAPVAAAQARAERALTLLDFWSQELVPDVLLQQGHVQALRAGDVVAASRIERRLRPELARIRNLWADAARDPLLGGADSVETGALVAARDAWAEWAAALLAGPSVGGRRLAALEQNAVRLHQAAYAIVDASLRAAVERRPSFHSR
jgi:hypothetical protein